MYALFTPRLRAMLLDAIILVTMFYGGSLAVHAIAGSDGVRRALWVGLIVCILLYEPLLVAMIGGTLGHRYTNLRVVDNQTNGNLGLAKAFARAIIKGLLGWLSFVTMTVARRRQAMHDIFTNSTVQARDTSKVRVHHFAPERMPADIPGIPSRSRRIVVITAYMFFTYILLSVATIPLLSKSCLSHNECSFAETIFTNVIVLSWLGLSVWFISRGWQGHLIGCRTSAVKKIREDG